MGIFSYTDHIKVVKNVRAMTMKVGRIQLPDVNHF